MTPGEYDRMVVTLRADLEHLGGELVKLWCDRLRLEWLDADDNAHRAYREWCTGDYKRFRDAIDAAMDD